MPQATVEDTKGELAALAVASVEGRCGRSSGEVRHVAPVGALPEGPGPPGPCGRRTLNFR